MQTIRAYKLLSVKPDGLHPLFIDSAMVLPIGEWLTARAPDDIALQYVPTGFALIDLRTQRPLIMQDRRPRRKQINKATHDGCRWVEVRQTRTGRHVYDIGIGTTGQVLRFAHRPGWHTSATPSLPAVSMEGKAWAEVLIPADDHYQLHRNISGLSRTHEPVDWYISRQMLILKVLTESPNETKAT